jgi:formamidopyrimidine-DNA glycosylase
MLGDTVMPELPDITAYLTALSSRVVGEPLEQVRITSPLLLRTAVPRIQSVEGKVVRSLRRLGKRIVFVFDGSAAGEPLFMVLHLMIAGRLHWRERGAKPGGRNTLAAFDFPNGSLVLTEAGARRRASLHVVSGEAALAELDPGGADVFALTAEQFREVLSAENHTLKRALTDPRVLSGVGNAYSDEILWAAKLSPLAQTQKLRKDEWERLYPATRETLQHWIDRFKAEAEKKFPEKVTAFRPEMAVHGRYGLPCLRCGAPIQRIRYASNETNYCPTCQTGGKVLADRSLSRLLGADWPRTLEELEALKRK